MDRQEEQIAYALQIIMSANLHKTAPMAIHAQIWQFATPTLAWLKDRGEFGGGMAWTP
jgi:hypothetical protein